MTRKFWDTVTLFNLNDLQKIVYAKRSMQGKAKLFSESEFKVYTYGKFKKIMLAEFGDVVNSTDAHEL